MAVGLNILQWIIVILVLINNKLKKQMNTFLKAQKAKDILTELEKENPGFNLWTSISAQLNFILNDFDSSGNHKKDANKNRVDELILGVQSIREIEPGNPELSELLCDINYEYKKLYDL